MSKIIHPGIQPTQDPFPWPVGVKMRCGLCSCRWEIEEYDHITGITTEYSPEGIPQRGFQMKCPNCGSLVTHRSQN